MTPEHKIEDLEEEIKKLKEGFKDFYEMVGHTANFENGNKAPTMYGYTGDDEGEVLAGNYIRDMVEKFPFLEKSEEGTIDLGSHTHEIDLIETGLEMPQSIEIECKNISFDEEAFKNLFVQTAHAEEIERRILGVWPTPEVEERSFWNPDTQSEEVKLVEKNSPPMPYQKITNPCAEIPLADDLKEGAKFDNYEYKLTAVNEKGEELSGPDWDLDFEDPHGDIEVDKNGDIKIKEGISDAIDALMYAFENVYKNVEPDWHVPFESQAVSVDVGASLTSEDIEEACKKALDDFGRPDIAMPIMSTQREYEPRFIPPMKIVVPQSIDHIITNVTIGDDSPKCECGKDKHGFAGKHLRYCPKFEVDNE